MIPLADLHCHLLPALDDGPGDVAEALEMARLAWRDGTRLIAATGHQNPSFPDVSADRLRAAFGTLAAALRKARIELEVFPTAEVMARPDLAEAWDRKELVSIGDRGRYLLIEMPHEGWVDLRGAVAHLMQRGVRPILAHPERVPELLHEAGSIEDLLALGCLVQLSADSLTHPRSSRDASAIRDWVLRGVAHFVGSDGHSPYERPPLMRLAYERIAHWAGPSTADRLCSSNATAVFRDLALRPGPPAPRRRRFWFWPFGHR